VRHHERWIGTGRKAAQMSPFNICADNIQFEVDIPPDLD
jgi:hypothetical protein